MKLESQVCSLEYAMKLRNLDVRQGFSLFYWDASKETPRVMYYKELGTPFDACVMDYFSAFTASELGEMLPDVIDVHTLLIEKYSYDCWRGRYTDEDYPREDILFEMRMPTLSNLLASMLIHLLENGLIKNESHNNTD